ncbi:MAG: flavin reductase family protein [Burkholderiaceae bacterium]
MGEDNKDVTIELSSLEPTERYKILSGVIVPRPIAWVTTVNEAGLVNAAPYSFFNVFSEDPPLVVLGLQHYPDGSFKDTTRNIHATGEFVVNLCDEAMAHAMNETAVDFPGDISETDTLGLATHASMDVKPPRLADAPFSFECVRHASLAFGPGRELLIGRPVRVHARAGLLDTEKMYIDYDQYQPVGRLFGSLYARQRDIFSMTRQSYAEYLADQQK